MCVCVCDYMCVRKDRVLIRGANCFNPYYGGGMALLLSGPLQPLINILYIWQCFLYHCLLMGGIIAHSIIRQSAKDQLSLRGPGSRRATAQKQRRASGKVSAIAGITTY